MAAIVNIGPLWAPDLTVVAPDLIRRRKRMKGVAASPHPCRRLLRPLWFAGVPVPPATNCWSVVLAVRPAPLPVARGRAEGPPASPM